MNKIYVDIDFTNGILEKKGIDLITGDYASTEIEFTFDESHSTGRKVFEMKSPSNELVIVKEIENNKVLLAAKDENQNNVSLFNESGYYIFEVSYYDNDSKLTSVYGKIPVEQEQVVIDGEVVTPYLPIFDQLMQEIDGKIDLVDGKLEDINEALEQVNTAITEANNLDLDVSKSGKTATVTLTKKDTTTKTVTLSDGTSLQFMWQGTSLGIKTDDDDNYTFVNIQGPVGPVGPQGNPFQVKKTYATVQLMIADYDNMEINDYVMISGNVEQEDNAKLFVKTEQEDPTYRWQYLADFSGASGVVGPQGASVTSALINSNGELILNVE